MVSPWTPVWTNLSDQLTTFPLKLQFRTKFYCNMSTTDLCDLAKKTVFRGVDVGEFPTQEQFIAALEQGKVDADAKRLELVEQMTRLTSEIYAPASAKLNILRTSGEPFDEFELVSAADLARWNALAKDGESNPMGSLLNKLSDETAPFAVAYVHTRLDGEKSIWCHSFRGPETDFTKRELLRRATVATEELVRKIPAEILKMASGGKKETTILYSELRGSFSTYDLEAILGKVLAASLPAWFSERFECAVESNFFSSKNRVVIKYKEEDEETSDEEEEEEGELDVPADLPGLAEQPAEEEEGEGEAKSSSPKKKPTRFFKRCGTKKKRSHRSSCFCGRCDPRGTSTWRGSDGSAYMYFDLQSGGRPAPSLSSFLESLLKSSDVKM